MYSTEFTTEAIDDLRHFRRFDQEAILRAIQSQLMYEPNVVTRNRKPLRANPLSQWELRVGDFRVFYNIEEHARVVRIIAIGYKEGNKLFIRGQEYEL